MRGTVPHTAVNRAERSHTMNTKKFLSILLALAMTLVLGSCGGTTIGTIYARQASPPAAMPHRLLKK